MPILSLKLTELGPFDEVAFEFDPQANAFVGPNNCGKSTALFALASLCVGGFRLPSKLVRSGVNLHLAEAYTKDAGRVHRMFIPRREDRRAQTEVGGVNSADWLGARAYTSFTPALRWSTSFRSAGPATSPVRPRRRPPSLFEVMEEASARTGRSLEHDTSSLMSDREIVQEIIELDYRSHVKGRPLMRSVLDRIAAIASEITEGFSLRFAGVDEDKRGFYPAFETPDGKLPLDVLSQGTQSLIQWLARLFIGYARHYDFPKSLDDKPGILIIDEIDAHLHPSWQRRIIPALTKTFPALQVFCSTHSPLMLAGLKAGQIHLLRRDAKGKVVVSRNETDIVGWTADEIITSFLGMDSATDMHTAGMLKRLEELRAKQRLSANERLQLEKLRTSVHQSLLSGPAAADIEATAKQLREAMNKTPSPRKPTPARGAKRTSRHRPVTRRQPTRRSER